MTYPVPSTIWRDYSTAGDSGSGKHDPEKQDIRDWAMGMHVGRLPVQSDLSALTIPADVTVLSTSGYAAVGDGGQANYIRVDSEPSHEGKVRTTDRYLSTGTEDATNGGWWEYAPGPEGINVRALGAADDADSTTAFQNAKAVQIALASAHTWAYSGTWDHGIPPIFIPAGTYEIDLSGVTNGLWEWSTSDAASRGVHIRGAGKDATWLRITDGTGKWIFYNNNKVMDVSLRDFSVYDETGNANGLYYSTSAGTAKRHVFSNVNTYLMEFHSINGTANGDHTRCENCQVDQTPNGSSAFHINNAQAIDHVYIGCEITQLAGRGLDVEAGGVVEWFGGSIVVYLGGEWLHIEGTGSEIGTGNGKFDFYSPKVEMRNSGSGNDPLALYIDAIASVDIFGGVFAVDETSGTRSDQAWQVMRGQLNFHGSRIHSVMSFYVDSPDNGGTIEFAPEINFRGCQLRDELANLVTIEAPSSSSFYACIGRANAIGCIGIGDDQPVDVSLNASRGQRATTTNRKVGHFANSLSQNSALPNSGGSTFKVPTGARVFEVGIYHDGTSSGSGNDEYDYVVSDGGGTGRVTLSGAAFDDDVIAVSSPFIFDASNDTLATFAVATTANGANDNAQRGDIWVLWE